MIRRTLSLTLVAAVALALFYVSRYWPVTLWERGEMFGLPPQGGLLRQWLRQTPFAPFELVIWGLGAILLLSALQKVLERD